jgi:hypothetical protein
MPGEQAHESGSRSPGTEIYRGTRQIDDDEPDWVHHA